MPAWHRSRNPVLPQRSLFIDAARHLALQGGALTLCGITVMAISGLRWHALAAALLAYGVIGVLILSGLEHHAPHRRFGPANSVTLLRAAYAAFLVGVLVAGAPLDPGARWLLAGFGFLSLLLDGVDGWAARRSGFASAFGARFDLETDAFFVLALSALLYHSGQAGAWVLTAGLMRYTFVAAGWLWPALAAPLPPSRRRKVICVVLILALLTALTPAVGGEAARLLCFAALALLIYSFGADCVWLIATARRVSAPLRGRGMSEGLGRSMGSE